MLRPLFWLDKRELPFGGPLWISFSTNSLISALKPASQDMSCGLRPALFTELSKCWIGILYWTREVRRTSVTISAEELLNIKWIAVFPNASCSVKIVSSGISLLEISPVWFLADEKSPLGSSFKIFIDCYFCRLLWLPNYSLGDVYSPKRRKKAGLPSK